MAAHRRSPRRRTRFITGDRELLGEGPCFDVDGTDINPALEGFTMVHNYAHYFWRPYLGNTAFSLWELLLSFCYGDCDTAYPSIARLARMLTNSDHSRAVVTGRESTLTSQAHEAEQPTTRPGYVGALRTLRSEGLVQVMVRGQGPTARYTFRILKALPPLRPSQLSLLSPRLQRDHALWLERFGIDNETYRQAFRTRSSAASHHPNPSLATRYPHPAPRTTTDATGTTRRAPRRAPLAQDSTNNTKQKDQMNSWWKKTLSQLRLQLQYNTIESCLLCTKLVSFQDGTLTLEPRGKLAYAMIQRRLAPLILDELAWASNHEVQRLHIVSPGEGPAGSIDVLADQPPSDPPHTRERECAHSRRL